MGTKEIEFYQKQAMDIAKQYGQLNFKQTANLLAAFETIISILQKEQLSYSEKREIAKSLGIYLGEYMKTEKLIENGFLWELSKTKQPILKKKETGETIALIPELLKRINNSGSIVSFQEYFETLLFQYGNDSSKSLTVGIDYAEYCRIKQHFNYQLRDIILITSGIILLFFSFALIPPDPAPLLDVLLVALLFIGSAFILIYLIAFLTRRHAYLQFSKKQPDWMTYSLTFYDTFLEKKGKKISQKIDYQEIWKWKETRENIYLLLNKKQIILIPKKHCNEKFLSFLKNALKSQKKIPTWFEKQRPQYRKRNPLFLTILIALTIACIWGGPLLALLTHIASKTPDLFFIDHLRVAFFLLPIPIVSILIGIFYQIKGYHGVVAILIGMIVSVILVFEGGWPFLVRLRVDYQTFESYEALIGVQIPSQGTFFKMTWEEEGEYEIAASYIKFKNKKESDRFYQKLMNQPNWILERQISWELAPLIPDWLTCQSKKEPCYYMVYIPEINTYNEVPEMTGRYHATAMNYDPEMHSMRIAEFIYEDKI